MSLSATLDRGTIPAMGRKRTTSEKTDDQRIRLIADADEELNQAIVIRAAHETIKQGRKVSKSEVICGILRKDLQEEIKSLKAN